MSGSLVPALVARADAVVDAVDPSVRTRVGLHLLDALGCLVAGVTHPSVAPLRRFADLVDEAGPVPVLGDASPRSLRTAVLLESTYLHLDEFDAIHSAGAVVPPAVVVPAALAVAARVGSSGRDLADALLGGYEVVVEAGLRLGGPGLYAYRWWPTAALGALGAAWATARLLGLDEAGRRQAVALAAHASGGPIGGGALGEGHYLAGGRAAACGVEAGYQAAAGLRGDVALLDGGLPGAAVPPTPPTGSSMPHLLGCAVKRYPFARPLHAALAALDRLSAEGTPVARARRVEVHLPAPLCRFVTDTRSPQGPAEAAASATVAVAAHVAGRTRDVTFIRAALSPAAPPVELVPAEDLTADLPARWSARVEVCLPDAAPVRAYVGDAPSLDDEREIVEKYHRNVGAAMPGPATELIGLCAGLDELPSAARLRAVLLATVTPTTIG
ncbi:MmgE/PrpD family protein [Micromonospora sp. NPDC003816]|uniref:MmgE/PrpD family protein n=1 Tax=Micromonospora sp. NPDC003816 TaxID=3364224 RepID=UPI0036A71A92